MTKRRSRTTPVQTGLVTPKRVGLLLLLVMAIWFGWGFGQKMLIAYRLNSEVQQLQRTNAQIAAANRQYAQQLKALAKPNGAEEEARLHNYVKPDEKVYIIAVALSPSPRPLAQSLPGRAPPRPPEGAGGMLSGGCSRANRPGQGAMLYSMGAVEQWQLVGLITRRSSVRI